MADSKVFNSKEFSEKRLHKRVPNTFMVTYKVRSPFAVRIKFSEKEYDAVAEDISEGGLGLITNNEIPLNARVRLKFTIFNGTAALEKEKSHIFEPEGEVRYGSFVKGKDFRLGVCFVQISMADRIFISEYVKTQELKPNST